MNPHWPQNAEQHNARFYPFIKWELIAVMHAVNWFSSLWQTQKLIFDYRENAYELSKLHVSPMDGQSKCRSFNVLVHVFDHHHTSSPPSPPVMVEEHDFPVQNTDFEHSKQIDCVHLNRIVLCSFNNSAKMSFWMWPKKACNRFNWIVGNEWCMLSGFTQHCQLGKCGWSIEWFNVVSSRQWWREWWIINSIQIHSLNELVCWWFVWIFIFFSLVDGKWLPCCTVEYVEMVRFANAWQENVISHAIK